MIHTHYAGLQIFFAEHDIKKAIPTLDKRSTTI